MNTNVGALQIDESARPVGVSPSLVVVASMDGALLEALATDLRRRRVDRLDGDLATAAATVAQA